MKKLLTLFFFATTTPLFSVINYDLDDAIGYLIGEIGIDALKALRKKRKNFKYDDILADTLKPEGFMGVKLDPSSIIEDKKLITMLFDNEALQNGDFSKTFLACIKYYPEEVLNYIREHANTLPNHLSSPNRLICNFKIKDLDSLAVFCRISGFYIPYGNIRAFIETTLSPFPTEELFKDRLRAIDLLLGQQLRPNDLEELKNYFESLLPRFIANEKTVEKCATLLCLVAAHGLTYDLRGYEKVKALYYKNAANRAVFYDAAVAAKANYNLNLYDISSYKKSAWDKALDKKLSEYKHSIISFYKPRNNNCMIPQIDNVLAYYDYVCGKTTLTFPENYDTTLKQAMNVSAPFIEDSGSELFFVEASKLTKEIQIVDALVDAQPELHDSLYYHYLARGITPEKEIAQSTAYLLYNHLLKRLKKTDEDLYIPQEEIFEFTPFEKIMKESQKIFNIILDKEVDYKFPTLPNKKLISKALLAKMMEICLRQPNTTYEEFQKSINKLLSQTGKNFFMSHKNIELSKTEAEQFFNAHKNDSFVVVSSLLDASLEASQKLQSNLLKMKNMHEKSIQKRY